MLLIMAASCFEQPVVGDDGDGGGGGVKLREPEKENKYWI